jgi:hypothetical protein
MSLSDLLLAELLSLKGGEGGEPGGLLLLLLLVKPVLLHWAGR